MFSVFLKYFCIILSYIMDTFEIRNINSDCTTVLFIHEHAIELEQYLHSSVACVLYNSTTSSENVFNFMKTELPNLQRVGIAFHFQNFPLFMDLEPLFTPLDLEENTTVKLQKKIYQNLPMNFSTNLQWITDLIQHFSLQNIDFLGCNLLSDEAWKMYFQILKVYTDITVGASENETGNFKYGGDWILESSYEDVQNIYFHETVSNYAQLLNSTTLDNITYTYSGSSANVIGSSGVSGTVVIPDSITVNSTTYDVTAFSGLGWDDRLSVLSVTLPEHVTSLGNSAFSQFSNLTSVHFDFTTNLTTIGSSAFFSCTSLSSIDLIDSITFIGNNGFHDCHALTDISMPSSLTSFENSLLLNCSSLTKIAIPDNVHTIGTGVFQNADMLTKITLPGSLTSCGDAFFDCGVTNLVLPEHNSLQNLNFSLTNLSNVASLIIPNNVTSIGENFWTFNDSSLNSIAFRSSIIPTVHSGAFENTTNITLYVEETSVIGGLSTLTNTFTNWNYQSVLPSGTHLSGNVYFDYSTNFNASISSIVSGASETSFVFDDLFTGTFHYDVSEVGDNAFQDLSNISQIVLPESIQYIGNYSFNNCGITSLSLPNNTAVIGSYAFKGCTSLASINIPTSLTSLGVEAFMGCSTLNTDIVLPSSLTTLSDSCFSGCSAVSTVDIHSNEVSIGNYAFNDCANLTKCDFHDASLNTLGQYAFHNCSTLANVNTNNTINMTGGTVGRNCFTNCTDLSFSVVVGSTGNAGSIGISAFQNSGVVDVSMQNVTSLERFCFQNATNLQTIAIPSVTDLNVNGKQVMDCSGLKSIYFGTGVGSIPTDFANSCTSLTYINSFSNVTSIDESGSFKNCSLLTSIPSINHITYGLGDFENCDLRNIDLSENIIKFGNFRNNENLTSIGIGTSLTLNDNGYLEFSSMTNYFSGFSGCTSLSSIPLQLPNVTSVEVTSGQNDIWSGYFMQSLHTLGNQSFRQSALQFLKAPQLTSIGVEAFDQCTHLTNVSMSPISVSIDSRAFRQCTNLTNIFFPKEVVTLSSSAFESVSLSNVYFTGKNIPNITTSHSGFSGATGYTISENVSTTNAPGITTWIQDMYVNIPEQTTISSSPYTVNELFSNNDHLDTEITGSTLQERRAYTTRTLKYLYQVYETGFQDKDIYLSDTINLPGFYENNNTTLIFNNSVDISNVNYVTQVNYNDLRGKQFYVIMDTSGSGITLNTENGYVSVSQTNSSTFTVTTPENTVTQNMSDRFSYDNLIITFGSVFGELYVPISSVFPYHVGVKNQYFYAFHSVTKAEPNVMKTHIYDDNKNLQYSSSITFGSRVKQILEFFEQNGATPYIIGKASDTYANMDVSYFGTFRKGLSQNHHRRLMRYIDETYSNLFSHANQIFNVSISSGSYVIDNMSSPALTFSQIGVYVFDQSDSSNLDNPILFRLASDGSAYTQDVVVHGTPGKKNASTLIEVTSETPSLEYYNTNITGNTIDILSSTEAYEVIVS